LAQIKAKTSSLLKITLITISLLTITTIIIVVLINNKLKQLNLINQQLSAKGQDNQSLDVALAYLGNNQQQIDLILNTLPNESQLIDFIAAIESMSATFSNQHSIEFSALAPTGSGNWKYIPLILKLTTDQANFELFLAGLEKLPYIVEVTSIDSQTEAAPAVWNYTLAIRVYVQNPFKAE